METLASLPVFFKLKTRKVLLAGGGPPAVWKAELLAAAGARVMVVAEAPCPEMIDLAARSDGAITLMGRRWVADDFGGVALAIGDIEDHAEAAAFQAAARAAGIPANLIDKPAFCDFQFGTIVARSPLLIGISTEGAAPVFGQAIRTRIEAILPQSLRAWAEAAREWRPAVQARNFDFRTRRRFWEVFAQRALAASVAPTAADQAACFSAAESQAREINGSITLVGCGSGTADGITLAGVAALQGADVLLVDPGVQPAVVGLGRRESRKISADDERQARAEAHNLATMGSRVVWLGTGNPLTCRRWDERWRALEPIRATVVEGLSRCEVCQQHCQTPA